MDGLKILSVVVYIPFFVLAVFGNTCVVLAVYKHKHLQTSVNIFFVNLATSDLVFILLTVLLAVQFMVDKWLLGDVICRIYGAFIEVSYTVSILTLTVVAGERYMSVCRPLNPVHKVSQCIKVIGVIWFASILFCSPLFYGYTSIPYNNNNQTGNISEPYCTVANWQPEYSKQVFYFVHTVIVYLLPLVIMIAVHTKIHHYLHSKMQAAVDQLRREDTNTRIGRLRMQSISTQRQRNTKVVKILFVVTGTFFVLWSPFIVIRMMEYFIGAVPLMAWKVAQFLLVVSAAVNFVIYALMSVQLKRVFKSFFPCTRGRGPLQRGTGEMTTGYVGRYVNNGLELTTQAQDPT